MNPERRSSRPRALALGLPRDASTTVVATFSRYLSLDPAVDGAPSRSSASPVVRGDETGLGQSFDARREARVGKARPDPACSRSSNVYSILAARVTAGGLGAYSFRAAARVVNRSKETRSLKDPDLMFKPSMNRRAFRAFGDARHGDHRARRRGLLPRRHRGRRARASVRWSPTSAAVQHLLAHPRHGRHGRRSCARARGSLRCTARSTARSRSTSPSCSWAMAQVDQTLRRPPVRPSGTPDSKWTGVKVADLPRARSRRPPRVT